MPQYGAAARAGPASATAVTDTARRTRRRIGLRFMAGLLGCAIGMVTHFVRIRRLAG
jgi:hypothetical protein